MTWMRQPHHTMGLYPQTYWVGLMADEGLSGVQHWLQVLKACGTLRPLELLQLAGIDLNSPVPNRADVAYVGSPVDEVERAFPA